MTYLKKMKWNVAILCLLFAGLFACVSTSDVPLKLGEVKPPIPELAKAYTEFEIDLSQKNELTLPSGTKITVDEASLVDAEGNTVRGKATLLYREYHDAVDVLLSGIPMDFKVRGSNRIMQTAGMFDIQCVQDGKPVFIKEGEGVQVDFASFEEGTDYNFFSLKEEEGWQFVDYVKPELNTARLETEKEVARLNKKLKAKKTKKFFVFNFDAVLDIKYNNDWAQIEKNKNNSSLKRKVAAYDVALYNNSIYNTIQFKGNYYPAEMMIWKKRTKNIPSWVRKYDKDMELDIKVINGNLYKLTATTKDGKSFTTKIEAVAPLKYMFQYSPEKWKKNFAKVMKEVSAKEEKLRIELEKEMQKLELQARVIRSFKISGFGIFNYDKLMKEEDNIDIIASFKMDNVKDIDMVFCFPEDNKTLIKYPQKDWDEVVLMPGKGVRFLAILPDKTIGLYTAEDYKNLDFESLREEEKKPLVNFELVKTADMSSEKDLREILNM